MAITITFVPVGITPLGVMIEGVEPNLQPHCDLSLESLLNRCYGQVSLYEDKRNKNTLFENKELHFSHF